MCVQFIYEYTVYVQYIYEYVCVIYCTWIYKNTETSQLYDENFKVQDSLAYI